MNKQEREFLFDKQSANFSKFIDRVRTLFVQFSPMLAEQYPDHVLVRSHGLFSHPLFGSFAKNTRELLRVLESLNTLLPPLFTNVPSLQFQWRLLDDNLILHHTTSAEKPSPVMTMLCGRITSALLDLEVIFLASLFLKTSSSFIEKQQRINNSSRIDVIRRKLHLAKLFV